MSFSYEYARPALTVDCVVFGLDDRGLHVLLVERGAPPFEGDWALPGGFVHVDETLEEAARRELSEETGLTDVFLEQLYTFGALDRDPRDRVVSVAYYALTNIRDHRVRAATDARDAAWFKVVGDQGQARRQSLRTRIGEAPDPLALAFDHDEIIETAIERIRGKIAYRPIGFELLPKKFTLTQLQHLYETILHRELDKRNFRKKVLSLGLLVELNELEKDVPRRRARLYRFDKKKYRQLEREGFELQLA
jgi:8-oxo-dGTP diphosphatase